MSMSLTSLADLYSRPSAWYPPYTSGLGTTAKVEGFINVRILFCRSEGYMSLFGLYNVEKPTARNGAKHANGLEVT